MNAKYPLLIIACGLLLSLSACTKNDAVNASSIVGKWYVNKISIHIVSSMPGMGSLADTTFTGNAFNTSDYLQFNSDNTASVSASGDFSYSGKATGTDGSGNPITGKNAYTYSVSGDILSLKSTFLIPTFPGSSNGPLIDTIVSLEGNTLVLKNLQSYPDISYTTETYYTRAN